VRTVNAPWRCQVAEEQPDYKGVSLPLELALHPLLPFRSVRPGRSQARFGYELRLPGGPVLSPDDPLIAAFGMVFESFSEPDEAQEIFQADSFDPAHTVSLRAEGLDEDGDVVVGVWDAEGALRAGELNYSTAARVAAAREYGLEVVCLVMHEGRSSGEGRRESLTVLLYPEQLVRVDVEAGGPLQRPEVQMRPRLVLLADGPGPFQWWDPSGEHGPLALEELPVSAELATEIGRLRAMRESTGHGDGPEDFFDDMERSWRESSIDRATRLVWQRARAELGAQFAVGLLAQGMAHPIWRPEELPQDDDGEYEIAS